MAAQRSVQASAAGQPQAGVYYIGKSADVRMKCSKSDTASTGKGNALVAYEYLINEIWVDTRQP